MFWLFIAALRANHKRFTVPERRTITNFVYRSVTFQDLAKLLTKNPQQQAYKSITSALNFLVKPIRDEDLLEISGAFNVDQNLYRFAIAADIDVDREFFMLINEISKFEHVADDIFKALGFKSPTSLEFLRYFTSREQMESITVSAFLNELGYNITEIKDEIALLGQLFAGRKSIYEVILSFAPDSEAAPNTIPLLHEMFENNMFNLSSCLKFTRASFELLQDVLPPAIDLVMKIFDQYWPIDFGELDVNEAIKEFRDIASEIQRIYVENYKGTWKGKALRELLEDIIDEGLDFFEIFDVNDDDYREIKPIFDTVVWLFKPGVTLKEIVHAMKKHVNHKVGKYIKWFELITGVQDREITLYKLLRLVFDDYDAVVYTNYILNLIAAYGTQKRESLYYLQKVFEINETEYNEQAVYYLSYLNDLVFNSTNTLTDVLSAENITFIDEWINLDKKNMSELYLAIGINITVVQRRIESLLIFLNFYSKYSSARHIYNTLAEINNAIKGSENKIVLDFLNGIDPSIGDYVKGLQECWKQLKEKPLAECTILDEKIRFIKPLSTAKKLKQITVINVYNILAAIDYDATFKYNIKYCFQFLWDAREEAEKIEAKLPEPLGQRKLQETVLYDVKTKEVVGVISSEGVFYDAAAIANDFYTTADVSAAAVIYYVANVDLSDIQRSFYNIGAKVSNNEKITLNDLQAFADSIDGGKKPNKLSAGAIAGIVIGVVVVVAIACFVGFIVYRKKHSEPSSSSSTA